MQNLTRIHLISHLKVTNDRAEEAKDFLKNNCYLNSKYLRIKEDKFVEQITESLILDIIHVLQENVVDTKTDIFLRDLAIVIESIKSLLKRDFGRKHPMQTISDSIAKIHTLKDGRKVTDINYSKIIAKKQKEDKKDTEERQQELDIQFDPDIKLD